MAVRPRVCYVSVVALSFVLTCIAVYSLSNYSENFMGFSFKFMTQDAQLINLEIEERLKKKLSSINVYSSMPKNQQGF